MERERMSSFEWMGRVMGPDPFLHDLVVNGAKHRRQREEREAMIEKAWTMEADAWNRLASIDNLAELDNLRIAAISLEPSVQAYNKRLSFTDEIIPICDFDFRRISHHGTLCQQWQLR